MAKALLERKDVDQNLTWDLSGIFKTEVEFENAVKEAEDLANEIEKDFKGKLNTPSAINSCLDKVRKLYELITLTNTYSYLAVAVDQTNVENQTRQMKLSNISSSIMSKVSFVESEIIEAMKK